LRIIKPVSQYCKRGELMRIAIMGAGLAGLSCAWLLEKEGVSPTVYESKYKIGAHFANGEAIMPVMHQPYYDPLNFIKSKYGLDLQPVSRIHTLVIHGPRGSVKVHGELGYMTARGNHPMALEVQLGNLVRSKIEYSSYHTVDDLKQQYDYVIVATGTPDEAKRLGIWHTDVTANLTGAYVEGSFDPFTAEVWFDNDYAPQGYAFLIPYDQHTASLALAVPGTNINLEHLWNLFLVKTNLNYMVKDCFQLYNWEIGRPDRVVDENIILAGHAGGFVQPALGFGQFGAMLSGLEAGLHLLGKSSYKDSIAGLRRDYMYSLTLRRGLEKLTNTGYDRLIQVLRTPVGKYLLTTNRIPVLKGVAKILGPSLLKKGPAQKI